MGRKDEGYGASIVEDARRRARFPDAEIPSSLQILAAALTKSAGALQLGGHEF